MSPEITRVGQYRIYFWSHEEDRMHVHVRHNDGRYAKVWIEPEIEIARQKGFKEHEIKLVLKIVREIENVIKEEWKKHREG